ncbi:hypothetical protein L1887_37758 [Cichorium endivia]|nr:hypothetical protein L1887_37758 [Cichorium endivia]
MVVYSYSTAAGGQYGVENVIEKLGYETNLLITPQRAVGIRMSQSSTRIELASMAFAPPNPLTPLCSFTCFIMLGMSITKQPEVEIGHCEPPSRSTVAGVKGIYRRKMGGGDQNPDLEFQLNESSSE